MKIFDDTRQLKVVVSPSVARELCNRGHYIVKIKPKKDLGADDYSCGTVFLFERTDAFMRDFYEILNKKQK